MKSYSIIPIFFLLVLFHINSINGAEEVEDEREFDYEDGSKKGPKHWGELKTEWKACKNGKMQSPIDMSNERVEIIPSSKKLFRIYKPSDAVVVNRGHDISVKWTGNAGSIRLNGTECSLQQAHWHSPSEHSVNGRRYDLELHMVHQSKDNKIAVIGVLYKIGKPDPFLAKVKSKSMGDFGMFQLAVNITSMIDERDEHRHPGVIDPREIHMSCRRYYRYIGSLTVPPCTEEVIWTISKKVRTVSKDQVKLLREAVHDFAERNARPLQPIHQRDVQLYGPTGTSRY